MEQKDFDLFKSQQYFDNENCSHYGQVGSGNLRTHSLKRGQVKCNKCNAKLFSVRKGTIFFDLRTPIDKIISVLSLLNSWIGVNALCREQKGTSLD